jgi:hypothetical protein
MHDALRVMFSDLMTAGALAVDDPAKAARRFNWLVMAEPVNRAMLLGQTEPPSKAQIEEWATDGVEAFLAIYVDGECVICSEQDDRSTVCNASSRRPRGSSPRARTCSSNMAYSTWMRR